MPGCKKPAWKPDDIPIRCRVADAHVQVFGLKASAHIFPSMFLPPGRLPSGPTGRRYGMDYDDAASRSHGHPADAPLPPGDWVGHDHEARMEDLYSVHRARVAGIFRRSVPPQDVQDLVQETFRRLISAKGHSAGFLEAPAAYLASAARSILKNRKRSGVRSHAEAHHSFEDHHVAGPDPHTALEQRDLLRRAETALAALSTTTQDVFLMRTFDNLDYSEIARIKGMSVKRVEKHVSKALKAIRKARDAQS